MIKFTDPPLTASGRLRTGPALTRVQWTCLVGLLSAVSVGLMGIRVPLPGFPVFLKYDPADVPALLAAMTLGPATGAFVVLARSVITVLLVDPNPIGVAMNLLAGLAFILGMSLGPRIVPGRAVVTMLTGIVTMVLLMSLANFAILPGYLGLESEATLTLVFFGIAPFNLLKGLVNGSLTLLLRHEFSRGLLAATGDPAARKP